MTDKEMAEHYIDSVEGYEIKTYSISDMEQAYLAGLEKGREQARSQMMAELGDAMQTWR